MEKKFDINYKLLSEKDDNSQMLNHVYSVVTNSQPLDEKHVVAMLGKDKENELHLVLLRMDTTSREDDLNVWSDSILRQRHRKPTLLAIDPSGEQTCVIFWYETICHDTVSQNRTTYNNEYLWEPTRIAMSRSMIFLKDQRAVVVASRFDEWKDVQQYCSRKQSNAGYCSE